MEFLYVILWIAFGFVYSNGLEWTIHKYILHGLGRRRGSIWSFHIHDHHKIVRKNNYKDTRYRQSSKLLKDKELMGLVAMVLLHVPTIWISPVFFLTLTACACNYYRLHKKSHNEPEWAKTHLPWHWDHHMGNRQAVEANWCVTFPFFDVLMGTRVRYLKKEKFDEKDN